MKDMVNTVNIITYCNDAFIFSYYAVDGSNDLIEGVVPLIDPERIFWPEDAMHRDNDLSFDTVCEYLCAGRIVIGNVNEGGHFVLITGYSDDGDTFQVNDPGYHRDTYSYKDDIVGYRIFDMIRK